MNLASIPSAIELRAKIGIAKNRALDPIRAAGNECIKRFKAHLEELLTDPSKFTSHTSWSEEIKGAATNSDVDFYIGYIHSQLSPMGYRVEKSHDGGGMYSTVLIRWDIEPRPRATHPQR